VNFQNAIKSGFTNYTNFKGRASRSAYWYWALFIVVLNVVLSSVSSNLGNLGTLATLIPGIAVGVRRMHDTSHRGWWLLVPVVNLVFLCQASHQNENQFGPPPPPGT